VCLNQAKYLRRAKIDPATVHGFGHASKLLETVFSNTRAKLASPKVVALMQKMSFIAREAGITDFSNVTTAQQAAFFKAMNQRKKAKKSA
jgi:hypothetical protein